MILPRLPKMPQKTIVRRISQGIQISTLSREGVTLEEIANGIKNRLNISDEELQQKVKITEMSYEMDVDYKMDVFFDVIEEEENERYEEQLIQYSIDFEYYDKQIKIFEQYAVVEDKKRLEEKIRNTKLELEKLENQLKAL
jgi:hypothetical protein